MFAHCERRSHCVHTIPVSFASSHFIRHLGYRSVPYHIFPHPAPDEELAAPARSVARGPKRSSAGRSRSEHPLRREHSEMMRSPRPCSCPSWRLESFGRGLPAGGTAGKPRRHVCVSSRVSAERIREEIGALVYHVEMLKSSNGLACRLSACARGLFSRHAIVHREVAGEGVGGPLGLAAHRRGGAILTRRDQGESFAPET
jgi:hypothetical protein